MNTDITFRGMETTEAIENYVAKYFDKFQKYLGKEDPEAIFVHVVLEGNHNHHMYSTEVRVKTPNYNLIAKRNGQDMYPVIDETMKVMERELEKAKEKMVDAVKKRDKCCPQ